MNLGPGRTRDRDRRRRVPHLRDPRQRQPALLGVRRQRPARLRAGPRTSATTRRPAQAGPVDLGRAPRGRRVRGQGPHLRDPGRRHASAAGASAPTAAWATAAPATSTRAADAPAGRPRGRPHRDRDRRGRRPHLRDPRQRRRALLGLRRQRPPRLRRHQLDRRRRRPPAPSGPSTSAPGRSARAITAGFSHTCALLDDGTLRCWGFGGSGRLGYGDEQNVGDDETPASQGPVPMGGSVPSLAANLTVGIAAENARPALGGPVGLSVTVANGGPDPTAGVALSIPAPAGFSWLSAAPGGFDGGAGRWNVGSLAPGTERDPALVARAGASGSIPLVAEVASSSVFDPTSTPGNGVAEDDRAVVVLTVPGSGGRAARRLLPLPRSLSLTVRRAAQAGPPVPDPGRGPSAAAEGAPRAPLHRQGPRDGIGGQEGDRPAHRFPAQGRAAGAATPRPSRPRGPRPARRRP